MISPKAHRGQMEPRSLNWNHRLQTDNSPPPTPGQGILKIPDSSLLLGHAGDTRASSMLVAAEPKVEPKSSTPATVSSQHNSEHFPPASQKSFCQPYFNCSLLRRSKQFPRKFRRLQKRPQTHETERLQVKSEHTGAKKQFSQDPFTLMEYQQLFMVSQTQDQTWLLPRVGGLWEYNTTREA